MEPTTVTELIAWMRINCYHFDNYNLDNNSIYEGFGLEYRARTWVWYYTERGNQNVLANFSTEQEAVAYAFKMISNDRSGKTHLVGFVKDTNLLKELIAILEQREISYSQSVIPYTIEAPRDRYMVFVFGCDIKKVADLKETYCIYK